MFDVRCLKFEAYEWRLLFFRRGKYPSIVASDTRNSDNTAGDLRGQSPKSCINVATAVSKMQKTGAGMTNICIGCGGCSFGGVKR